jgi:hypothetical protein
MYWCHRLSRSTTSGVLLVRIASPRPRCVSPEPNGYAISRRLARFALGAFDLELLDQVLNVMDASGK